MVTREQKVQIVKELVEKLADTQGIYIVDYEGITVEQAVELRSLFREKGIEYKVAKNTLIKRALKEDGKFEFPDEQLKGMSALILGKDDPVAPAKVLQEFFKKNDLPKLKGAIIDGQKFDGSQLKALAALPTRDDMMAAIVGSLGAPASGIVGSINAVIRDLAYLVEEVHKEKAA